MREPVLKEPADLNQLLLDLFSRPNICSKEWICRQYDHEVQGTSVIKPLVGVGRDINSDAVVLRPVLNAKKGLAFSQALLPFYSAIDAYHMTQCTVDESVRRLLAVGADFDHIGGVDNFCWPNIQYDPEKNPDGKFKAAQLVRSCKALREICMAYEIPLLSGKDSMYVDGHLAGPYGETHKISALETLQFSATSVIPDIQKCITMETKIPGDLIYILGYTRDECGASEYYEHFGYVGENVPHVLTEDFAKLYRLLSKVVQDELVASVHGVYRGGLGIHLAMIAMGGGLGLEIDLSAAPLSDVIQDDKVLFSESAGRFIVSIDPDKKKIFEDIFSGLPYACIGKVIESPDVFIKGLNGQSVISLSLDKLKAAWKRPFGELI